MPKIMIVDDSSTIRFQVVATLSAASYVVVEAADGEEALSLLSAHPDVALVICDLNMPQLDGLDFLERLKSAPTTSGIDVLMLTSEGQPELITRAKALGAKGWIVKPFKPSLLVAAVAKLAGPARTSV